MDNAVVGVPLAGNPVLQRPHRRRIDEAVICVVEYWTSVVELRSSFEAGGFRTTDAPRTVTRLIERMLRRGWVDMAIQAWPAAPEPTTDWRGDLDSLLVQAGSHDRPEKALVFMSTALLDELYWPHVRRRP